MTEGNRRQFTRVPLPFPARIEHAGGVIQTRPGVDISATGMALRTEHRLPRDETCRLQILLGEGMAIEATAVVARELDDGFAIRIEELDLQSFELLKNLIRFNAENPEEVDDEFLANLGLRER